jgi:methyl-accepting chemotaxis protein
MAAMHKSQAIIEFDLSAATSSTPTRISARPWATSCAEIKGKHHRIFRRSGRGREHGVPRLLGAARAAASSTGGSTNACHQERPRDLDRGLLQPGQFRGGKPYTRSSSSRPTSRHLRQKAHRGRRQAERRLPLAGRDRVHPNRRDPHRQREFLRRAGIPLCQEIQRAGITGCSAILTYVQTEEYRQFWERLGRGRVHRGRVPALRQGRQGNLDPGGL